MVRFTTPMLIEDALYTAGCGFALWKGGRAERLVAAAMLLELVVGTSLRGFQRLEDPRYVSLLLDLGVLAAVLFVAFTTDLRWPLLGSALQILSVLCYIARIIDPTIHSWAYITIDIALGFGLLATVIYGAAIRLLDRRNHRPAG